MDLDAKIEAYLFYKGEPEDLSALARFFEVDESEVQTALDVLQARLTGGITLVIHEAKATLTTSTDASGYIEKIRKEEVSRDLGKAGLETLSIIIYKGPVTRTEIDYIRGVNSSYIIRNLLVRGLIERKQAGKGASQYVPTIELLTHMGIAHITDMPQYTDIQQELLKKAEQEELITS